MCDDPLEEISRSLGLASEDLQELQAHIACEPVFGDSVPGLLRAFIRETHVDTWFHLARDESVVRTRRGTRPGSCIADVAFNLLFERVLSRRGRFANEIVPSISWSGSCELALFDPSRHSSPVNAELQDVAYADDHAACVLSPSASLLCQAVCHVMGRTLDSVSGHGLAANFGPKKTAALLAHRGKGSRQARNEVFHKSKGKILVLREHSIPVSVDAVPQYKHLGSIITFDGSLLPEIKLKVAQAKAAFGEGRRKVFACPHIDLKRRVRLCHVHVISALLSGAGAWPRLCVGAWNRLERCLTSLCRQMLRIPAQADQHWSRDAILDACDFPSATDLLAAERLRFLGQLARHGPSAAWALMQHCPDSVAAYTQAGSWLLTAVSATCPYPGFIEHWGEWLETMQSRPKYWKGLIKRATAWHSGLRRAGVLCDKMAREVWAPRADPLEAPDQEEHACLLCKRAFRNAQTWASHAPLQHGYRAAHYRLADGVRCRACGAVFANQRRHRTHLQVSKRCLQSVARQDPDLLPSLYLPPGHVQSRALPGRGTSHLPPMEEDVSFPLLARLLATREATDEEIFELVVAEVEALPVLRNTVRRWAISLPPGALREAAEDVLLCLRADVLCDAASRPSRLGDSLSAFKPHVLPLSWSPRPAGLPGLVLLGSPSRAAQDLGIFPGGGWRSPPFWLPPQHTLTLRGRGFASLVHPVASLHFGSSHRAPYDA